MDRKIGGSIVEKKEVDIGELKAELDRTNVRFVLLNKDVGKPIVARGVEITGGVINSVIIAHVVTISSSSKSEVRIGENGRIFCGELFHDLSCTINDNVKAGRIFLRPGKKCLNYILKEESPDYFSLLARG